MLQLARIPNSLSICPVLSVTTCRARTASLQSPRFDGILGVLLLVKKNPPPILMPLSFPGPGKQPSVHFHTTSRATDRLSNVARKGRTEGGVGEAWERVRWCGRRGRRSLPIAAASPPSPWGLSPFSVGGPSLVDVLSLLHLWPFFVGGLGCPSKGKKRRASVCHNFVHSRTSRTTISALPHPSQPMIGFQTSPGQQ